MNNIHSVSHEAYGFLMTHQMVNDEKPFPSPLPKP